MDLTTYHDLISSEGKAYRYLSRKCVKDGHRVCPRCQYRNKYKLKDGRYRCARCKYTYHTFSGRWINHGHLTCVQWLSILKLFELEVSVRKMAAQMGLSYRAAYGAVLTIRMAILTHAADADMLLGGEIELDESYFGGRRKGNRGRGASGKVPVFGILERKGVVQVSVVPNVTTTTLMSLTVRKVRRGSVVYTDRFK